MSQAAYAREAIKAREEARRAQEEQEALEVDRRRRQKWRGRMEKSPFTVDLVAQHEKATEEERIKKIHAARQKKKLEARETKLHHKLFVEQMDLIAADGNNVRAHANELAKIKRNRALESYLDATSRSPQRVTREAEGFRMHHKDLQTLTEQKRLLAEARRGAGGR